ncbi:putative alpha-ketoglutarate-dependent sulfonate dioxygenase [Lachnellula hyalina]|uniref:Putative alpha-ketoglutarate-dependent sulfonate dioxygenase n=1 Tax=Lachnellula hyalina TaxID=1316788 RepID=A0A8H8TV68_9HELO|nr:putative alpha-ketoglutarate-dependent sulfonate dioxygenase [Lachnellula hyalina]TVY23037.1 putative alpha-ketoglutarate-dependent sulfonate dioxygenase [Lachnellula hyalina]
MAPPSANDEDFTPTPSIPSKSRTIPEIKKSLGGLTQSASYPTPLVYSGTLDHYESFDLTSIIGREFPNLQITDILSDDAKIRDLAILVSQRGVVFFRNQDINIEDQKILGQKLGELTGKPATSKLHKHALSNSKRGIAVDENGKLDDEVSVISSDQQRKLYHNLFGSSKKLASEGWHADITFERVPSDYAILKITKTPEDVGGDTLWASGYEAFDRLSPVWQRFAEGLTATHYQPNFNKVAAEHSLELLDQDRGAPENKGLDFAASHPVVRTNPVTGWKSLFGTGHQVHAGWVDNVTETESEVIKAYFLKLITENHDLQVRFKWNKNDLAIWDNRSVFHTATNDYEGKRQGNRVVSLGEKPFYNPASKSRREALFGGN